MKTLRRTSVLLLTLLVCFVFVPVAFAHPLGNFTINHYAGLIVSRDSISIDYVLDMAEIPAFQEIATLDDNGNGQPDAMETMPYHTEKCAALQPDLKLLLNKKTLALTLESSAVEFPTGAGGLSTLRLTCQYRASVSNLKQAATISFADNSFIERIGWREIIVNSDGVTLNGDFTSTSISNRLTSYPEDLLSSPLDQREVMVDIASVSIAPQSTSKNSVDQVPAVAGTRSDAFTQLITLENITLPTILFALLISFIWGAMHAMTPGHGKTIVGAYLVGSRGTIKHALYLGLTTTITHTLGVFAFGLVTLFAAQYIVPEKLFPWITMLSGLFVVGIGFNLFLERSKSSGLGTWFRNSKRKGLRLQPAYSVPLDQMHIESANHTHPHGLVYATHHEHEHTHRHHVHDHSHEHADHSHLPPESITWRNLLALGISGGLLPCPSALVVLLGAIALNKIAFGLILVFAFSLGLAGALTAIGMLFIYAGTLFPRFPSAGKVLGFLPALSALFISAIGIGIMVKAMMEIGLL